MTAPSTLEKNGRTLALATFALTSCLLVSPLGEFERDDPDTTGGGGAPQGGNSGEGGNGAEGGTGSPEGGTSSGGGGMEAGAGAGGSPGGTGGIGGCSTNLECAEILGVVDPALDPVRCRPSDRTCVRLNEAQCFLSYGDATDDDAVFLGALVDLRPQMPQQSVSVYPLRLAIDEFNNPAPGDDRAPGLGGHSLVVTICDNSTPDLIDAAMEHLVSEVQVPAVLAAVAPNDLMRMFDAYDEVLYLSPLGRTRAVTALDDARDGETRSIWNLLGQPSDYVEPYTALIGLVEDYVRYHTERMPGDDLRLALIVNDSNASTAELADVLEPALTFNAKSVSQNGSNYLVLPLDPSGASVNNVVNALLEFRPDIVVSAAGTTFTQENGVVTLLDSGWAFGPRPFYVVSPYEAAFLAPIRDRIDTFLDKNVAIDLNRRVVALSPAPPEDTSVQNLFEGVLLSTFQEAGDRPQPDTGNFYDAMYYLAYAAYGAGLDEPLTGKRMAAGLARLFQGLPYDVGAADANSVLRVLADPEGTVTLSGTLGPPDFRDGYRRVNGSVICLEIDPDDYAVERRDVLIFNRDGAAFYKPEQWPVFPCFPDFFG